MLIGNIVYEDKIKLDSKFNKIDSIDDIIPGLPTLIVGINNAKSFTDKVSYLDRRISDDTFWTFNRTEKRDLFEEDLFYFIEFSYNYLLKDIKFDFIDLILCDTEKINLVFKEINNTNNVITFHHQNMVYTYIKDRIYGFDLRQVEYIGKSVKNFMKTIKDMSDVFLLDEKILIEYKKELYMFNDEIKYVPLIYFIRNNE